MMLHDAQDQRCVFCAIAQGKETAHIVWEDEAFMAFLSKYPTMEGTTVVIPKEHVESNPLLLSDERFASFMIAVKIVGRLLTQAFNVERTAIVLEGYGVNHLHAKLYPLHGTQRTAPWKPIRSPCRVFLPRYEGFLITADGPEADDATLSRIAETIRKSSHNGPYANK